MHRLTVTFNKGNSNKRVEFRGNYHNNETTLRYLRVVIFFYLQKRIKSLFSIPYKMRQAVDTMNPNIKDGLKKDAQMLINIQIKNKMKKSTLNSQKKNLKYLKNKYGFVFHFNDDGELTKHSGGSFISQLESIVDFYDGNSSKNKTTKRKVSNLNKTKKLDNVSIQNNNNNFMNATTKNINSHKLTAEHNNNNNFSKSINPNFVNNINTKEEEEDSSFNFDKNKNFEFGKFGDFENGLKLSINNKIEENNNRMMSRNQNGNRVLKTKES